MGSDRLRLLRLGMKYAGNVKMIKFIPREKPIDVMDEINNNL
jgi:hypothetical protein